MHFDAYNKECPIGMQVYFGIFHKTETLCRMIAKKSLKNPPHPRLSLHDLVKKRMEKNI